MKKQILLTLIILGISLDVIPDSFYHITAHKSVWFRNNEKNSLPVSLDMYIINYIILYYRNISFMK